MSSTPGRKLFLKLWYPAEPAPTAAKEMLWAQLRDDGRTPLLVRGLLRVFRLRTASYPGAALAASAPKLCPVVYNHGLVSFASENTSLMEDLASRGHVVIAVQHQTQWDELQGLNRQQSVQEKQLGRKLTAQIRGAAKADRAKLGRELSEASGNTNRITIERAKDTLFVLDNLTSILAQMPGGLGWVPEPSHVHLVGYSVGGAVATEVARSDRRVASAVNIDGGVYGLLDAGTVAVPYLMIYSATNEAINDELLPRPAVSLTAESTTHLNYHDVAGLLPQLRWLRALGRAEPVSVLQWRNRVVAEFIQDRQ
jgi:dienelactone hydrolase